MASYMITEESVKPRHISDVMQTVLERYQLKPNANSQPTGTESTPCLSANAAVARQAQSPAISPCLAYAGNETLSGFAGSETLAGFAGSET